MWLKQMAQAGTPAAGLDGMDTEQAPGGSLANLNLPELMQGNHAAVLFCISLLDQIAIYDDLIDGDKPVTHDMVHKAFWIANVDMPRNPFYKMHFDVLNPLIMQAINNWRIANRLENAGKSSEISFIIRSSYADILTMCCFLIGGNDYAESAGEVIRQIIHDEGLEAYLQEMKEMKG